MPVRKWMVFSAGISVDYAIKLKTALDLAIFCGNQKLSRCIVAHNHNSLISLEPVWKRGFVSTTSVKILHLELERLFGCLVNQLILPLY